jgi:hypothetical protein
MRRDEALDAVLDTIVCAEGRPTYAAFGRWVGRHPELASELAGFFATWASQEFVADEAGDDAAPGDAPHQASAAASQAASDTLPRRSGLLSPEGAFRLPPRRQAPSLAMGSFETPAGLDEPDPGELARQLGRRLGFGRVGNQNLGRGTAADSPSDDPPPAGAAARQPNLSKTDATAHGPAEETAAPLGSAAARPKS